MKKMILILALLFGFTSVGVWGQDVIINEFSQGSAGAKEWVELLVVTDNYNLQNYSLTDDGSTLLITFSGSGFASLSKGTLIVVYNGGDVDGTITPDLTYNGTSDKSLQISSLNSSGDFAVTRTKGWSGTGGAFANGSSTDIPQLFNASATNVFVYPKTPTPAAGKFQKYTSNSAGGSLNSANWSANDNSTNATPGLPNGGDNTTWITSVLPVEFTSFTANATNGGVLLNWATATEVNNYGFEIQASTSSASDWKTIGFVEGHGNSNSPKEYSYIDLTVAERSRSYRLKQIDTDGAFEYSDVVTVSEGLSKTELFQNHPNPFNPTTQISFSLAEAGKVNVSVYNTLGQKVSELVNQNMEAGIQNVDFNASNFTSGLYIYRLDVSTGSTNSYSKTMKMLLIK